MNHYNTQLSNLYIKRKMTNSLIIGIRSIALIMITILALISININARAEESDNVISVIYAGNSQQETNTMNSQKTEVGISPGIEETTEEEVTNVYQTLKITDEEFALLREIIALEAQCDGLIGEMACCEVIFNRVLYGGFGSSVGEVLRSKGQFSTLKTVGKSWAWATAGELEDDAISEVLRQGPKILPSTDYVYFSTGKSNGVDHIKIGNQYFGRKK